MAFRSSSSSSPSLDGLTQYDWTSSGAQQHPYRAAAVNGRPVVPSGSTESAHDMPYRAHAKGASSADLPTVSGFFDMNGLTDDDDVYAAQARQTSDSHSWSQSRLEGHADAAGSGTADEAGISQAGWSVQPVASSSRRAHAARPQTGEADMWPTRLRSFSASHPANVSPRMGGANGDVDSKSSAYSGQLRNRPGTSGGTFTSPSSEYTWETADSSSRTDEFGASQSRTPRASTSHDASSFDGSPHGTAANSNSRNFLIPISGTGARQKLSILNASQRPRTTQHASEKIPTERDWRPSTSSQRDRSLDGTRRGDYSRDLDSMSYAATDSSYQPREATSSRTFSNDRLVNGLANGRDHAAFASNSRNFTGSTSPEHDAREARGRANTGAAVGRSATTTAANRAQEQARPSPPGGFKGGVWKNGLKNIFARPQRSGSHGDASPKSRGKHLNAQDADPALQALQDPRPSPNMKACAILGEDLATISASNSRDSLDRSVQIDNVGRLSNLDEIVKAGWTAYQPRTVNEVPGSKSHFTSPVWQAQHRDRSASAGAGGNRMHKHPSMQNLDQSSSSSHSSREAHPSSSLSRTESWTSHSSRSASPAQSSDASRSTLTPEKPAVKLPAANNDSPARQRHQVCSMGATYIPRPPAQYLAHRADTSSAPQAWNSADSDTDATRSRTPVPLSREPASSQDRSMPSSEDPPRRPARLELASGSSAASAQDIPTYSVGEGLPGTKDSAESANYDAPLQASADAAAPASPAYPRERISLPLISPLLASVLSAQQQSAPAEDGGSTPTAERPMMPASSTSDRDASSLLADARDSPDARPQASTKIDPSTYVPLDALRLTRKGNVVQSGKAGVDAANGSNARRGDGRTHSASPSVTGSVGGRSYTSTYTYENDASTDAGNLLPATAWVEAEGALTRFRSLPPQSASERGNILRTTLLPFLALEAETPDVEVSGSGTFREGKARRKLFFDWIKVLLLELKTIQTSADRGAILESIACIIESRNFSAVILASHPDDESAFYTALSHIISYAIGELNKKGVYQNTLIFSGRLLAVAFFRIDGVASKLLRSLPVNRFALKRVADEAEWDKHRPRDFAAFRARFAVWLRDYCFNDAQSYLKVLDTQSGNSEEEDRYLVRHAAIEVEMSGNWLRRWQSDDSELFFSFCRSYHRQLSSIMCGVRAIPTLAMSRLFFGGPGYAHLATCIHQKCLSLVHRDILSVTTLSSQKNFNPGETANVLSGSTAGKPRHLEAANRRCTAIVVDIIRSTPATSAENSIFASMLGLHVKCLVKRTSLFDVQGVFCLLDWMDGVLTHMESADMVVKNYIDVGFLLDTIWLLLKDADHALALMRTIAFCYSNFAVLTSTCDHRTRFLEKILLDPIIFKKLFLSWSFTIRAYFLHLLVFRLARIHDFENPDEDPSGKTAIRVVKLFNQRLDEIRRCHDSFSPQPSAGSQSEDEDEISKRRRGSFVSTIKRTPSVHQVELSPGGATKAERILGITPPNAGGSPAPKAQSRAAKWLRVLGAGKGGKQGRKDGSDMLLAPPGSGLGLYSDGSAKTGPRVTLERETSMTRLDELDASTDSSHSRNTVSDHSQDDDEPLGLRQASIREGSKIDSETAGSMSSEPSDAAPPGEHLAEDVSFDLQNAPSLAPPGTGAEADPFPGDGSVGWAPPHSPQRVSRAFSRRRSMLPDHAMSLVVSNDAAGLTISDEVEPSADASTSSAIPSSEIDMGSKTASDTANQSRASHGQLSETAAYERHLHIYAVQSLREYEQTVQEHDDFFASQPHSATTVPQVPRLPIQWPAMWSE